MSAIEVVALAAVAIWLAVMTVILLLLFRQVSLLTAWMQQRTPAADDGLDAGAPIPEASLELMPELRSQLGYVLFLSGNCVPCREFALDTGRSEIVDSVRGDAVFFASVAGHGRKAEEVAGLLPDWVRVIRGEEAEQVKNDFNIHATPAVYEVEAGNVTGGATAGYGIVNFENLINARQEGSNASEFAGVVNKRNGSSSDQPVPEV